jgi:heme/copper-type cytochrome/quinol oxidase subunit 1
MKTFLVLATISPSARDTSLNAKMIATIAISNPTGNKVFEQLLVKQGEKTTSS